MEKTKTRAGAPVFEDRAFASLDALAEFLRPVLPTEIEWKDSWKATIAAVPAKNALWLFREWALANIFLFGAQQMSGAGSTVMILDGIVRKKPDISKNRFSSVGSIEVTSDIDVTIQGPRSHHVIAILEDICYALTAKGIPIRLMDIEFYVDYRLADRLFVNIHKFTAAQREELLKWGYVSYFRSIHKTVASPLARKIGGVFVARTGGTQTLDTILADAATTVVDELGPDWRLDREKAYAYYDEFELLLSTTPLLKENNTIKSNNTKIDDTLAANLFFLLTKAQLHQPENYILPSTVVDVVVIQQAGEGTFDPTAVLSEKPRINMNAHVSIDAFGLLASSLEQLGYLESYMPSPAEKCTPTAAKYYLRLLRALENAKILEVPHPKTAKIAVRTALERCGSDIDIPFAITGLETAKMAGGTRKRRRSDYKKRTRRYKFRRFL